MKSPKLSRGLLVFGLLMVALSVAWPYLLPKNLLWDDARAVELTNSSETLHEAMHAHGHGHDHEQFGEVDAKDDPEIVAAAQRYREAQSELDAAKFWSDSAPIYLRWSGLALCVVGLAGYFSSRAS